jgi:hypothetical protein
MQLTELIVRQELPAVLSHERNSLRRDTCVHNDCAGNASAISIGMRGSCVARSAGARTLMT